MLPAPGSAANPGRVADVHFNPETGTFSGRFTLDYYGTPDARSGTFRGVLLPGLNKGIGYLVVPGKADG